MSSDRERIEQIRARLEEAAESLKHGHGPSGLPGSFVAPTSDFLWLLDRFAAAEARAKAAEAERDRHRSRGITLTGQLIDATQRAKWAEAQVAAVAKMVAKDDGDDEDGDRCEYYLWPRDVRAALAYPLRPHPLNEAGEDR